MKLPEECANETSSETSRRWSRSRIARRLPACATDGTQRSTAQTVEDTTILARVETALINSPEVKGTDVNVDVRNGVVLLKGNVDTAAQARSAESLARNVSGVSSVRNDLRVAGR